MNDKILQLQYDLIKSQDSFKETIMSEPDIEKHIDIISKFSEEEVNLTEKIEKEFEKYIKEIEKENNDNIINQVEYQEDLENTNDNNPLVNTFKQLVEKGTLPKDIAKQFKENELVELGKEYGFEWGNKSTKIEKVNLLIEAIK